MAESREKPARRPDPVRIGRNVALGFWALMTFYAIGAGVISVIPQVFWPAEAHGVEQVTPEAGCGPALRDLHDELLEGAGDRVRHIDATNPPRPLFEAWDQRYRALEASCGALPSYQLLARLRYGVEEHLLSFEAEDASLAQETLRAIEAEGR